MSSRTHPVTVESVGLRSALVALSSLVLAASCSDRSREPEPTPRRPDDAMIATRTADARVELDASLPTPPDASTGPKPAVMRVGDRELRVVTFDGCQRLVAAAGAAKLEFVLDAAFTPRSASYAENKILFEQGKVALGAAPRAGSGRRQRADAGITFVEVPAHCSQLRAGTMPKRANGSDCAVVTGDCAFRSCTLEVTAWVACPERGD